MCFLNVNFLSKILFSYLWTVKKAIGRDVKTVLDLGCGKGTVMKIISKGENWVITGVELDEDYIEEAKKSGVYKEVIKGNIASLPKYILNKKFDIVLCLQAIEHISKKEGEKALIVWESLAKKRIVIATPVGFIPYERIEESKHENNPLLKHRSGWFSDEFRKKSYIVHGQGWRLIYGEKGLARRLPIRLLFLTGLLSYIFSPFVYLFPSLGQVMICKKIKK